MGSVPALSPIVDCNVHLWDQGHNPVFWLTDRTLVRELIGNYDSLPDVYTLGDYERETTGFDVRGIVWSDAGAADPVAAAEWVSRQHEERGLATGIVSLGDPAEDGFGELVDRLRTIPLVRSIRVRLASGLARGPRSESALLDQPVVMEHFGLMARHDLVATIEVTSDQVGAVARLARELPDLRIVLPLRLADRPQRPRTADSPRSPRRVGGEPECGDPPRRRRDDLRGVDHRPGAAVAPRGRGSIRSRPMHARLGSPDRAASVGLRDPVPSLRRDLRGAHAARPRAAAAGHGGAVVRDCVISAEERLGTIAASQGS